MTAFICPRNKKERALEAIVPGFVPPDGGTMPRGPTEDSPLMYKIIHRVVMSRKIVPITPFKSLKLQAPGTGFEPTTL